MDFNTCNKSQFEKIDWGKDTADFKFQKLGDFYKSGVKTVRVFGFFFVKSEMYGLQPVAIGENYLLNLPTHRGQQISELLRNADFVQGVKDGGCCLKIREYKSKHGGKTCYDFDFANYDTDREIQADIF